MTPLIFLKVMGLVLLEYVPAAMPSMVLFLQPACSKY
jgi:hypothetical protein